MKKLKPRKIPEQKRSRQMVDDILRASIRVLKKHGGRSFTTIRVAEAAGISVGSLYQYFPNKEALLFHLQVQEWHETWTLMDGILTDRKQDPETRLRSFVCEFFRTEFEEADLRRALAATQVDFSSTRAAKELRERSGQTLQTFLMDLQPGLKDLSFAVDFFMTTVASVGEDISGRVTSDAELSRWARMVATMLLHALCQTEG